MSLYYAGIGSRVTPPEILSMMGELAARLDKLGYTLRSGGAEGADSAFEKAVSSQEPEVYVPWTGFIKDPDPSFKALRNNRAIVVSEQPEYKRALFLAEKFHPNWDACSSGARKMHARNVMQVLGATLDSPSGLVICWTKNGGISGGTGQALRIATDYEVKVLNLKNPEDQMEAWQISGGAGA